jgi:hypothetical protein
MSERDGYEPGVPCGVAAVQPDPGADGAPPPHWGSTSGSPTADPAAEHAAASGRSVVAGPYDVPGLRQASWPTRSAAFMVSQLVLASQEV